MNDEVLVRLDRIAALLSLAFHDEIQNALADIRKDPLSAALLDAAEIDWIKSRPLQDAVTTATKAATRTLQRRLNELVSRQLIEVRGSTSTTEYRTRRL